MLTELRIQNFKTWKDTGPIRLAPITVFFGANSSGKTSLIQFLLMLKQTAESPDRRRVLHFGDRDRTPVELGTFRDVVHGHDESLPLWFRLGWTLATPLVALDAAGQPALRASGLTFAATIDLGPALGPQVETMIYALVDTAGELAVAMMHRGDARSPTRYEMSVRKGPLGTPFWTKDAVPPPTRFHGFPREAVVGSQGLGWVDDLTLALDRELSMLRYMGAVRVAPRRIYRWHGEAPEDVGWGGELTVAALLSSRERRLQYRPRSRYRPCPEIVTRSLAQLGVLRGFRAESVGGDRGEYEIVVRAPGQRWWANLCDVGSGVSQVLPVIVQCFHAPARSVLIFEHPETDLHPSAQAGLADLFIDAIHMREDGKPRDIQVIVESHSEHFLSRLQRRIAEGVVGHDKVAAYFCEMHKGASRLVELGIDPDGNIINWPESFFGDKMEDLVAMAEAQARRELGEDA